MLWSRSLAVLTTVSVVLAGQASPTTAAPPDESGPSAYYVVAYDGAQVSAAELADHVEHAGGEVVDVLTPLDVALVRSREASFLDYARATAEIEAAARNNMVGTAPVVPSGPSAPPASSTPSTPSESTAPAAPADRRATEWLTEQEREIGRSNAGVQEPTAEPADPGPAAGERLAPLQWGMTMVGATPERAHTAATGQGVDIGIIDTGIDATHPDLAANFDAGRSRDFVRPAQGSRGGPGDVDPNGHGTHVAGIAASAANGLGTAGVAPDATLVNLRAGNENGFFFAYEVSSALVAAGNMGLDVVNMSFFTDPWLYNCASPDDYISGSVSDEELAEQALIRRLIVDALHYAHQRGVTLVAAAGNEHTDLAAQVREDTTSPGFPPSQAHDRTVTNNCLNLPAEGPEVIAVSSVGPSEAKADYSSYGAGSIELAAPGGFFGDQGGTPQHQQPSNMVLSTYPLDVARRNGLADRGGRPTDAFSLEDCRDSSCGFYTYLQGTSMAAPFVTGVVALIVDAYGQTSSDGRHGLSPRQVARVLDRSASGRPCPAGGVADYTGIGRPSSWNAVCTGTVHDNSLYGAGIVNAAAALGV